MAYEAELCLTSKVAAEALPQYSIVELSATFDQCALAQANQGYGVVQQACNANDEASIAFEGFTRVRAGAAITRGQFVTSANSGWAVAVGSAATTASRILGRAEMSIASGMIGTILIEKHMIIGSGQVIP